MPAIRTPDQRLRVFISSTIEELKEERLLLRQAIESLRLTPVFFEAGARPHPPRELYRAYLDQSDIFIGIYARSYGWVAPDMSISGLEDEYRLSSDKPQLIYIKELDVDREERLAALLNDIRNRGSMSYQKFRTPEQAAELLLNDLAVLLSERFSKEEAPQIVHRYGLPAMRNATIGRDRDREELAALIMRPNTALVTLTGTGGTGKSHLALRVAHEVASRFADGAAFVPLAGVQRPGQVMPAIAAALGVVDGGSGSLLDAMARQLVGKQILLVLDNFEHVLEAAPQLTELVERLPKLMLLVTSRAPLHLVGEHVYAVQPLAGPLDGDRSTEELLASPSVDLFVQRARARAAQITLDAPNVRAIADLCIQLDGLPLAIELAAAHSKYFTPVVLAKRFDRTLDLLTHGPRDLPERQRTMRAAIASSAELLTEAERVFFRRLAVLSERWSMDLAATVTDAERLGLDTWEVIEHLVDVGLVRLAPAKPNDLLNEPLFQLLHVVREYAGDELDGHSEREAAMLRLQAWCFALVEPLVEHPFDEEIMPLMARTEAGLPDIRNVVRDATEKGRYTVVWELVSRMGNFLSMRGYRHEALGWLKKAGLDRLLTSSEEFVQAPAMVRGNVLLTAGILSYDTEHMVESIAYFDHAFPLLQGPGVWRQAVAVAWLFLTVAQISTDDPRARESASTAVRKAREAGDRTWEGMALCITAEVYARSGDLDTIKDNLALAEEIQREAPSWILDATIHQIRGDVAMIEGTLADAVRDYEASLAVPGMRRSMPTLSFTLAGLGNALILSGRWREALPRFLEGIDITRQGGSTAAMMLLLRGLGWCCALLGEHQRGARLIGAAEGKQRAMRMTVWTLGTQSTEKALAELRTHMSEEELQEELLAGARLKEEDVIALALEVPTTWGEDAA